MKVWVYVEGKSDKIALTALFDNWMQDLRRRGWGIEFVSLKNKSEYLKKIGPRAAEKLLYDTNDLVVGLPDLYPNLNFGNTEFRHSNLRELKNLQVKLVERALQNKGGPRESDRMLSHFHASALKHDLEMLLLAVPSHLQSLLKMQSRPHGWRFPPEDQNQNNPPKRIVEELFRVNLKRSYLETNDSHAILRNVEMSEVLFDRQGNEQCPAFRAMLDWIVEKTGVHYR